MLHLAPETVVVAEAVAGNTEPLDELLPKIMEGGVREVSPNGVLGDPDGASAYQGAELFAALVDDAVEYRQNPVLRGLKALPLSV